MGVIADRLRAQLSEMKARHAETDRLVQEHHRGGSRIDR